MTPDDPRDHPDRSGGGAVSGAGGQRRRWDGGPVHRGREEDPGRPFAEADDVPGVDADLGADADPEIDDRASAALDGTIATGGLGPVTPAVAARVAAMAAARDAVRAVPGPDPARRDRAITAALAAFDDAETPATGGHPQGLPAGRTRPPDELAGRRAAGRARNRPTRRLVTAAAAAVVVVAMGVGVAVIASDRDETTTASDTMRAADQAGGDHEGAEAGGGDATNSTGSTDEGDARADAAAPESNDSDSGAAVAPEATASVPSLGEHPSVGSLLDAAAGADGAPAGADTTTAASTLAARCPTGVPGPIAAAGDATRAVASGTVDGDPIEVWRGGAADAPVLVALDAGCQVVGTRPLG